MRIWLLVAPVWAGACTPFCDPSSGNQVVCYQFEGTIADRSGNGNVPVQSDETYGSGIDGMAVRTGATTESFDIERFAFEAWVFADEVPAADCSD